MKKILVLAAAMALVSSTVFAAGIATLTVSAAVQGTCSITAGTLAFGSLDPTTPVDVGPIASAGVAVTCNNGTVYSITDNAALNPLSNGVSTIPFALAYAAGGTGTGAAVPVAINGSILGVDYAAATAGVYASTVTLSVTP